LWILARLGRALLPHPLALTLGAMLWNLGVTVGIAGILAGHSTGFEFLEMPNYAAVILFLGYLLMGIWGLLTFHQRRERQLYVSQWFLLAAIFWFPWIYSSAYLLLGTFPVRGVTQAVIAWWFSQNLLVVWLGLVGLSVAFYFLPKLSQRELPSRYLALMTFWLLLLLGSWGGVPPSAPVPAWMPTLSTVATVLMVITILTVVLNFYDVFKGNASKINASVSLQFLFLAVAGFVLAAVMNILNALPQINQVIGLTWFNTAKVHANLYGFFVFAVYGAMYYIVPQLAGMDFPKPKLVRVHLWLAVSGILLLVLPLAIGGIVEGYKLRNPNLAFLDISKSTLMFLRISTLGDLLLAAGHVVFLLNLGGLVSRYSRPRASAAYAAATADLFKTAGAKP